MRQHPYPPAPDAWLSELELWYLCLRLLGRERAKRWLLVVLRLGEGGASKECIMVMAMVMAE